MPAAIIGLDVKSLASTQWPATPGPCPAPRCSELCPHLTSTCSIGAAQPSSQWHLMFQRATEDLGFHWDLRRREISREGFPQTWNSQKKKTSWIRFPLLKDLVRESKQSHSLRTSPAVWSIMEVLFKILYVWREKRTYEKNAWKKWMVFKYEKFGKASGAFARRGLAIVTRGSLLSLDPSFTLFLPWALCLNNTGV